MSCGYRSKYSSNPRDLHTIRNLWHINNNTTNIPLLHTTLSTPHTQIQSIPTLTLAGANNPLVTFLSLAMTTPSLANIPTLVPALLIASMAYSTWWRRPSGEKVVVEESYRRAMVLSFSFVLRSVEDGGHWSLQVVADGR
jgi:hypothetical protein